MVELTTSLGRITVELYVDDAPLTVENFLTYVDAGFYDGTVFHRVIPGFMVQCGGLTADLAEKPTRPAIQNEAANGLKNQRGTLAMARTEEIHSATSQFFINLSDNTVLDHGARNYGYVVFGTVTDGMDVVDRIAGVPTGSRGGHQDVPVQSVIIESARRVDG